MADKPAGSIEQSEQICLFTVRQCGTLAMTTGAGLDIYLVCVLTYESYALESPGRNFSSLALKLRIQCFSSACVRFCINRVD